MKKAILIASTFFVLPMLSFGQPKDKILDSNLRMQTEVFVLDTKDPSQLSFVRKYDNNNIIQKLPIRKLEVLTNRFSAFMITNINPLRYNYFINDELVTQFMDAAPSSSSLLNSSLPPIGDLASLPIFNYSSPVLDSKEEINFSELKNQIKSIKNALAQNSINYFAANDAMLEFGKYDSTLKWVAKSGKKEEFKKASDDVKKYHSQYAELSSDLENKLQESLNIVSKQNTNGYYILKNLSENDLIKEDSVLIDLKKAKAIIGNTAKRLSNYYLELDTISGLLQRVLYNSFTYQYEERYYISSSSNKKSDKEDTDKSNFKESIGKLRDGLAKMNYYSQVINSILNNNFGKDTKQKLIEEIININELISLKKAKGLEEFLLTSYLEIGKLLQLQHLDFSRTLNLYSNKNYIDSTDLKIIKEKRTCIKDVFTFIQKISADLGIVGKSLRVNDNQFKDLVLNINTNYLRLLEHLKKIDYLSNNNIVQYSLPTHNNLKNIDLVRYKIDRDDIITKSKQSYVYDIWLKGGIKVDFSIGIMGSGLTNREFNKLAFIRSDGTISNNDTLVLKVKDQGRFDFAFGGMVNLYRRNGASWINWGGSIGVVYSVNQKLQFIVGPTIHFGKTERLILHGGIAMGFISDVDESQISIINSEKKGGLVSNYLVKGVYNTFNIPSIEKFSVRPFIGISYNLSKKNALQAISSQGGLKHYNTELSPTNTTLNN